MKTDHLIKAVVSVIFLLGFIYLLVYLFNLYKCKKEYQTLINEYQIYDNMERVDDPGHYFQTVEFPVYGKVKSLTAEEATDLKDGVVFFGYPTCPWCRNTLPLILEVVNEQNHILYYNQLDLYRDEYKIVDNKPVQITVLEFS